VDLPTLGRPTIPIDRLTNGECSKPQVKLRIAPRGVLPRRSPSVTLVEGGPGGLALT
jgi:hypothetical protein